MSETEKAMQLPDGKTCADCRFADHCVALGFTWLARTQCDFYPSRFLEQPKTGKQRAAAPRET